MRRNKIDSGWNAIPDKRKKQRQAKKRLSWISQYESCLLYTSDAADDLQPV